MNKEIYRVMIQGPSWKDIVVCFDRDGDDHFETNDLEVARDYQEYMEISLKKGKLYCGDHKPEDFRYFVAKEGVKYEEVLI